MCLRDRQITAREWLDGNWKTIILESCARCCFALLQAVQVVFFSNSLCNIFIDGTSALFVAIVCEELQIKFWHISCDFCLQTHRSCRHGMRSVQCRTGAAAREWCIRCKDHVRVSTGIISNEDLYAAPCLSHQILEVEVGGCGHGINCDALNVFLYKGIRLYILKQKHNSVFVVVFGWLCNQGKWRTRAHVQLNGMNQKNLLNRLNKERVARLTKVDCNQWWHWYVKCQFVSLKLQWISIFTRR